MHLRATAALLALVATPAFAGIRPAFVYPLQGEGVPDATLSDVQDLVQAALARRRALFSLGAEQVLENTCGPAKTAQRACLAKLAGGGVVLRGSTRRAGRLLQLKLSAIDAGQRESGPVTVDLDPVLQNPEPIVSALELLGAMAEARAPSAVAQQATPAPGSPRAAPVPPGSRRAASSPPIASQLRPGVSPPRPVPPPPATETEAVPRHAVTSVRAPVPEPATSGLERAGKWTAAGGAVLLAGGGVIGLLNGRLNSQLTQRYQEHTLAQSDLSSYHRVHTFNLLANAMFIAGGVAAATGLGLWIAAPDADEVQAGVSGRF